MTGFRVGRAIGLALLLTLTVSACGDGDAGGAPSASSSDALGAQGRPSVTPGGSPSATASRKPPPSQIPDTALLQPIDAGNGWSVDPEGPLGDWGTGYTLSTCPAAKWTSDRKSLGSAARSVKDDKNAAVLQSVVSFPAGQGNAYLDEFRANVKACADFSTGGTARTRLTIVQEGFAGEESLMIETTRDLEGDSSGPQRTVLVRQDDLVTEVAPTRHTPDSIAALGKAAASRLCVIANC